MITRRHILEAAQEAVQGRPDAYGQPEDSFDRIAARWALHVRQRHGVEVRFDAADVALMLVEMKAARLMADIGHADSWVDIAGYAACGGEVAT